MKWSMEMKHEWRKQRGETFRSNQSRRWAPFIWKDSGFGLFQEMTQKAGRKSASCQLALCKKAPPLLLL